MPRVRRALEQLLDGQDLVDDMVPAALVNSWARTSTLGLQPSDSTFASLAPGRHEAKRLADQHRQLIALTSGHAQALHKSLPNSPEWVVLCISTEGLIVHGVGCRLTAPRLLQAALQVGRSVQEAELGTTAASCALAENSIQVVMGEEHYLNELNPLICAAVPFCAPDGTVAGVLDVSGVGFDMEAGVVERLMRTTRQIENDLIHQLAGHTVIGINDDPRLLGTAYEGLIALNEASQTCYLNARARSYFGLEKWGQGPVPVERLFEPSEWKRLLFEHTSGRQTRPTRDTRGFLLYASRPDVSAPTSTASSNSSSTGCRIAPSEESAGLPLDKDSHVAEILRTGIKAVNKGVPLILEGESGTGKEVMAKAIHRGSQRADKPLVAINCAAIPEGLIEAELFGYVDGAFTGGRRGGSAGKIEQAQGGILFLDEIGDMPVGLQTRLLRVLQERQFTPVGGVRAIPVEFALVCATHRDLSKAVEEGKFRSDLFYRINSLQLRLPALRERRDLKDLIQRFLLECGGCDEAVELEDDVYGLFASYSWPGNIRQLRNVIQASVILAGDHTRIRVADLPEALKRDLGLIGGSKSTQGAEMPLAIAEFETIRRVLQSVNGNVTRSAALLGVSRSTLHKRLRETGLR